MFCIVFTTQKEQRLDLKETCGESQDKDFLELNNGLPGIRFNPGDPQKGHIGMRLVLVNYIVYINIWYNDGHDE